MQNEPEQALALDERARREALNLRRSLLLQAPAGSGKTTVLTARFLAALAASPGTRGAACDHLHPQGRRRDARSASSLRCECRCGSRAPRASIPHCCARRARAIANAAGSSRAIRRGCASRPSMRSINRWRALFRVAARAGGELSIAGPVKALYRRAARQSAATCAAGCASSAPPPSGCSSGWTTAGSGSSSCWRECSSAARTGCRGCSRRTPRDCRSACAARSRRCYAAELAAAAARLPEAELREAGALLAETGSAGAAVSLAAEPSCLPHWRALCALALTEEGGWRQRLTARRDSRPAIASSKLASSNGSRVCRALRARATRSMPCAAARGTPGPRG